ncbi:MAG: ATP-binding cassette domain-containing protein [Opitutae bacterium]|nr:ATP-binding cassette domain-containing protein [Opitutae bacterium]MBT5690566.1 ATP-binding cassette domain-containing protein [Opitutae bacterium]
MPKESLIKADKVSKKYCKDLKLGLLYGVQDIIGEFNPFSDKERPKLRREEFWANDDISFEVHRGDCLGLIGSNGAGKSTLLKMLNGLIKPDSGRIEMRGKVCALIELGAGFNPLLTGLENVYINGTVLGLRKSEIDAKLESIVEFSEIGEFLHMPVQSYSSGMKVRLGFSVAIHLEPDILLLDEILAVGDAAFRAKCFNAITEISRNAAVIFVSHFMPDVSTVCSELLVLGGGRMRYLGDDVTEGIDKYHQLFSNTQSHKVIEGRARLESIQINGEVFSKERSDRYDLQDDQPMRIDLWVDCIDPLINAGIVLTFHETSGKPVAQSFSSTSGFVMEKVAAGLWHVGADFLCLPFAPGRYTVTVSCMEMLDTVRRGEIYFRVENVFCLLISGSFPGYTPVQLRAKWLSHE